MTIDQYGYKIRDAYLVRYCYKDAHEAVKNYGFCYSAVRRYIISCLQQAMLGTTSNRVGKYDNETFAEILLRIQSEVREVRNLYSAIYNQAPDITARQLQSVLENEFEIEISTQYINRLRKELGFEKTRPRYCALIKEQNKVKRLQYAVEKLRYREDFYRYIFSDECLVQLGPNTRDIFVEPGNYTNRLAEKSKYPAALMIFGGISVNGATDLVILDRSQRIDSAFYLKMVNESIKPFYDKKSAADGQEAIFMQDGARAHTANATLEGLAEMGIRIEYHWPPESPDLNPIEIVWAMLKNHLL